MKSPKVPMSSTLATNAPAPKPPPTATPTNLSKPDALFNSCAFLPASNKFLLPVVFTYLFPLIALTKGVANCLAF